MFNNHEEIKELYDANKEDIFYEKGDVRYEVRHLGSTIYCHDVEKGRGMGAITNFEPKYFISVKRPVKVEPEIINEENKANISQNE